MTSNDNFYIYRGHSSIIGHNDKNYNIIDSTNALTDELIINDFTFTIPEGFTFITLHEIGELSSSLTTSKYIFNAMKEIGYEKFKEYINEIIQCDNIIEVTDKVNKLKKKMIKLYLIKLNINYKELNYDLLVKKVNTLFDEMINELTPKHTQHTIDKIIVLAKQHIDKLDKIYFNAIVEYIELLNQIIKDHTIINRQILDQTLTKIMVIKIEFLNAIEKNIENNFINYFLKSFGNINVVKMLREKKKEYSEQLAKKPAWTQKISNTFDWINEQLINDIIKALNFNINIFKSGSKMYKLFSNMELSHPTRDLRGALTGTRSIFYNGYWTLEQYLDFDEYSYIVDEPFDANDMTNRDKFRSKLYPFLINNDEVKLDLLIEFTDEKRVQLAQLCNHLEQNLEKIIDTTEYESIITSYPFVDNLVNKFNFTGKTYFKLLRHIEAYLTKLNPGIYLFNTCGEITNNIPIVEQTKTKIVNVLNNIKFNKDLPVLTGGSDYYKQDYYISQNNHRHIKKISKYTLKN